MSNKSHPSSPVIVLGEQLKSERQRPRPGRPQGYGTGEIPKTIGSKRTIERLEAGYQDRVDVNRVVRLCRFYETDSELTSRLEELAEATHADHWWDAYGSAVDKHGFLYFQREDRATHLKFHDSDFIPSLIQPKSYFEMIVNTTRFREVPGEVTENDMNFRVDRQQRWLDAQRPATFVIGEAALSVRMGDDVMQDVRRHLLDLAELSFVDIKVAPFSAGRYDLMGWEANILEFDNGDETVIRTKIVRGSRFIPPESHAGRFFQDAFNYAVSDIAIPVKEYFS